MTAPSDTTTGSIMDKVASLMNDTAKSTYGYTEQIPYLQIALQDLRTRLEQNNSPVTNSTSFYVTIPAGTTVLGFGTTPALPQDLIEIQQVWERQAGSNAYSPLDRVDFIPHYLEGAPVSLFSIYAWKENQIEFPVSTTDNDIKLDYIKTLFTTITDQNGIIGVINSESYLQFRTAALCAQYIGENKERADVLNAEADMAFNILIGIDNKGRQAIYTRRRPFRASWKNRAVR